MSYSENFKIEAKLVLNNSYVLEKLLEEGNVLIGNWIQDEIKLAKKDLDKERLNKLNNLYFKFQLEK